PSMQARIRRMFKVRCGTRTSRPRWTFTRSLSRSRNGAHSTRCREWSLLALQSRSRNRNWAMVLAGGILGVHQPERGRLRDESEPDGAAGKSNDVLAWSYE